jgi:glutathione peroxidase
MKALILTLLASWMLGSNSMYELKVNSIDGKMVDLSQYKGKTLLIVNVASKCGYTPQYTDLQKLNDTYGSRVTILGFPANNFKGQEPGSNAEIAEFCSKNYGVTFQMFEKISVIGEDQHPLYAWLKEKTGNEPTWNFCKYIVKPDGTVKFFNQKVSPMAKEILDEI